MGVIVDEIRRSGTSHISISHELTAAAPSKKASAFVVQTRALAAAGDIQIESKLGDPSSADCSVRRSAVETARSQRMSAV
jgi:hypothetical protein